MAEPSATERWLRFKRAYETVRLGIIADTTAGSGVPEPELSVLVHLHEAGGVLRQNAVAASTGWDRTRLSHLLTRMEARGLVSRRRLTNGAEVVLEPPGRALLDGAGPQLEAAARSRMLDRLDADDRRALDRLLDRLLG